MEVKYIQMNRGILIGHANNPSMAKSVAKKHFLSKVQPRANPSYNVPTEGEYFTSEGHHFKVKSEFTTSYEDVDMVLGDQ